MKNALIDSERPYFLMDIVAMCHEMRMKGQGNSVK